MQSRQKVPAILKSSDTNTCTGNQSVLALLLLAALVLQSGQPCDILRTINTSDDVNVQAGKLPTTSPTVRAVPADIGHRHFLAVERQIALQLQTPEDIAGALLGAFLVFSIKYPDKLKPLFLALEYILLRNDPLIR
jgi:hypothetical protein